jgi:hypothetical protein
MNLPTEAVKGVLRVCLWLSENCLLAPGLRPQADSKLLLA